MTGQMYWQSSSNHESQLILHLRRISSDPWQPHTSFPQYKVPDYLISNGSEGWSTYHKLRQVGWILISTAQAQNTLVRPEAQPVQNSYSALNLGNVRHFDF
jgi:hypothetical protein